MLIFETVYTHTVLFSLEFKSLSNFDAGNLALGKHAVQIGTYGNYTADKAVDGNWGENDLNYCAVPYSGSPHVMPWWYVDLGEVYSIESVYIELASEEDFPFSDLFVTVGTVSPNNIPDSFTICSGASGSIRTKTYGCRVSAQYIMVKQGEVTKEAVKLALCEVSICGFKPGQGKISLFYLLCVTVTHNIR